MSYFVDQNFTKITEKQVHKNRNGYKVLGIVIHCVLKFRFDGLKMAVNTVGTLEAKVLGERTARES